MFGCNKAGHTSSECFKNKKPYSKTVFQIHPQNNFNKNKKFNSNDSYIKTCNYCKRTGHTITECRKRQFNENRRENANSAQNDNSHIRSRVAPAQLCEQENFLLPCPSKSNQNHKDTTYNKRIGFS